MDSVTRFAMAQREVGLATKPPQQGYTLSICDVTKIDGASRYFCKGSITAIYTVLVDGGDMMSR